MNNEAILDIEREVDVFRGDTKVATGNDFIPGETLAVTLSDFRGQFVFEVSGATFVGGSCGGTRSTKRKVALVAPEDSAEDIRIWAGWSTGQTTVRITPAVVLKSVLGAQKEEDAARFKKQEEDEILKKWEEYRLRFEREKTEEDYNSGKHQPVKPSEAMKKIDAGKVRDHLFDEADQIRAKRKSRPLERVRADDDDGATDDNDAVMSRPAGPLRQSAIRPSLGGGILAGVALIVVVVAAIIGAAKFRGKKHYN